MEKVFLYITQNPETINERTVKFGSWECPHGKNHNQSQKPNDMCIEAGFGGEDRNLY